MKPLTLAAALLLVPLSLGACAPAAQTATSTSAATRSAVPNAITVAAQGERQATLVYYPGAKVKPEAYRWLGEALAPAGIQTVIVGFPLDFAFLSPNRANEVLATLPTGSQVYLAGHSLGGAMAAQYTKNNPSRIKGLILMGAYPANNVSLRDQPLRVLDLLAERDGVATPQEVEAGLPRLPESTQLVRLPGAVHSYFGRYGTQNGDGTPTASREATEALIIQNVKAFVLGK
jgi:Alpha/beta hydrolase family